MNRKKKNEPSAFTIMLICGLFLLSFFVILMVSTLRVVSTFPIDMNQFLIQPNPYWIISECIPFRSITTAKI